MLNRLPFPHTVASSFFHRAGAYPRIYRAKIVQATWNLHAQPSHGGHRPTTQFGLAFTTYPK